jgi:hypothetical protein
MVYRPLMTVATLVTMSVTAANAQMSGSLTRPFSFGIAAGAAVPVSTLGNVANTGTDVTGLLGIKLPLIPVGFRIDADYNTFGYNSSARASGSAHISSITGNVVLDMPLLLIHPYLIGGLGYYNVGATYASSSSNVGVNIGAGVGIGIPLTGVSIFAETRYHRVNTSGASTQFMPVVAGVTF